MHGFTDLWKREFSPTWVVPFCLYTLTLQFKLEHHSIWDANSPQTAVSNWSSFLMSSTKENHAFYSTSKVTRCYSFVRYQWQCLLVLSRRIIQQNIMPSHNNYCLHNNNNLVTFGLYIFIALSPAPAETFIPCYTLRTIS